MEGMTEEQWIRKYVGTHKGIHCLSDLAAGAGRNGSLIKMSPGDKNIMANHNIHGKNLIEKKCMEDRAEDFKHFLLDTNDVRANSALDQNLLPYKDLLALIVKTLPQKVEQKTVNFTFADMVQQAALDKGKIVDVEPIASNDESTGENEPT